MSTTTNFLYDGANPVQEQNGSGVTANLLTGGIDERFQRTDSTGTYSYLTDALGSTMAMTNSTGAEQTTYSYGPYGILSATGTNSNDYTYSGREADGLGIDYYRARYYSPSTGRFISEDPMGFAGSGPNLYEYAADSPANFTDPSGDFIWHDYEDFQYYGNYCGPGWTGGRWESYDPGRDLPFTVVISPTSMGYPRAGVSPGPYYSAPVDNLDAACEQHDKCYYYCRANNKCDRTARANCMTQCNQALGQAAANSGVGGIGEWFLQRYMNNASGDLFGMAGPNDPSCKCSKQ